MGDYCSVFAGLCGHCKGQEELIQLLVEIVADSLQCCKHVLDGFGGLVIDDSVGIVWWWGVFLGNPGVHVLGIGCMGDVALLQVVGHAAQGVVVEYHGDPYIRGQSNAGFV